MKTFIKWLIRLAALGIIGFGLYEAFTGYSTAEGLEEGSSTIMDHKLANNLDA